MLRRILLATVMVAATTTMALPASSAAPATEKCGGAPVKVYAAQSPGTVSVRDFGADLLVDVVVTITGPTFTITAPQGANYTLVDAGWCWKAATGTSGGTVQFGLTGTSTVANKNGALQDIGYVALYHVTTAPTTTCYDDTVGSVNDLLITGPVGQLRNAYQSNSTDGTCSGGPFVLQTGEAFYTVVGAATYEEAATACAALNAPNPPLGNPVNGYWDTPPSANLWLCPSF